MRFKKNSGKDTKWATDSVCRNKMNMQLRPYIDSKMKIKIRMSRNCMSIKELANWRDATHFGKQQPLSNTTWVVAENVSIMYGRGCCVTCRKSADCCV